MEALKFLGSRTDIALPFADLLGQKRLVDVGQNSAIGDGHRPQKLAQLLVVSHRQLDVPRHYTILLVISRSVPSKLQYLIDHNQPSQN